jgi:hypothetical protein
VDSDVVKDVERVRWAGKMRVFPKSRGAKKQKKAIRGECKRKKSNG